MKTHQFLSRIISLSGDMESNPFPTNRYCTSVHFISPTNSVSLLKFRLSQLSKTAVDAGGGGDCVLGGCITTTLWKSQKSFLCAQWWHWIFSESPWPVYRAFLTRLILEKTSCQGIWADAVVIQAVANFLNLSNIAESNSTFFSSYCCRTSECYKYPKPLPKQKAKNLQHIRQINKQSVRKRQRATVLAVYLQITCSCHELQPQENKYDAIAIYDKFVSCSAPRTALQNMCDDNDWCSHPV